jgi:hypothetical protein
LKFGILRVPPIQIPTKKGKNLEFGYANFTLARTHLAAFLVTILGFRNLKILRVLKFVILLKFCWIKKNRCRTNLMHFLLQICGKFTRALLAHQIFLIHLSSSEKMSKTSKSLWVEPRELESWNFAWTRFASWHADILIDFGNFWCQMSKNALLAHQIFSFCLIYTKPFLLHKFIWDQ